MSRLWPILFSICFFSACVSNPEVEILNDNQLMLSYEDLELVFNKDQGGSIGRTNFKESTVFNSCQDHFPSVENSYRQNSTSIVHDSESVFARTDHEKLNINRSIILKDSILELNWKIKNSRKSNIKGIFELEIELAKKSKLKTFKNGAQLFLNNGSTIEIISDNKLSFKITDQTLLIFDSYPRIIKPLHRSSQKITFKFLD